MSNFFFYLEEFSRKFPHCFCTVLFGIGVNNSQTSLFCYQNNGIISLNKKVTELLCLVIVNSVVFTIFIIELPIVCKCNLFIINFTEKRIDE